MYLTFSSCVLEGKDPPAGFFQEQPVNLEKDSKTKKSEYHCLNTQVLEKKWDFRCVWPSSSPTGSLGLCSAMAAREFAGAAEDMGATTRAEGSIARADHLKAAYWDAK